MLGSTLLCSPLLVLLSEDDKIVTGGQKMSC